MLNLFWRSLIYLHGLRELFLYLLWSCVGVLSAVFVSHNTHTTHFLHVEALPMTGDIFIYVTLTVTNNVGTVMFFRHNKSTF